MQPGLSAAGVGIVCHYQPVAKDRLDYYQSTRFASEFNAEAIRHLEAALAALNARTANREARAVEGTHGV